MAFSIQDRVLPTQALRIYFPFWIRIYFPFWIRIQYAAPEEKIEKFQPTKCKEISNFTKTFRVNLDQLHGFDFWAIFYCLVFSTKAISS